MLFLSGFIFPVAGLWFNMAPMDFSHEIQTAFKKIWQNLKFIVDLYKMISRSPI
jgi:hypothetical protein